ncbi:MAG: PH domain-containing protein [Candidatus Nanohaloarchaea archaeon]
MAEELDWLTLDEDEEVLWSGNPKLQRLIGFTFTDYVVTDQALYRKSGIFSRNVQKIGYDKVQNTSFSQGILGKAFGYGNVEISTAGGSGVEMRFRAVSGPKEVQELVNRRIKSGGEGEKSKRELLAEILEEVRKIRESVK